MFNLLQCLNKRMLMKTQLLGNYSLVYISLKPLLVPVPLLLNSIHRWLEVLLMMMLDISLCVKFPSSLDELSWPSKIYNQREKHEKHGHPGALPNKMWEFWNVCVDACNCFWILQAYWDSRLHVGEDSSSTAGNIKGHKSMSSCVFLHFLPWKTLF